MLEYMNAEKTMIAQYADRHAVIVEITDHRFNGLAAMSPMPFTPPKPLSPAEILAAERAQMECTRRQARIVLGPEICAAIDALADDPETPWAMRQTLLYAQTWYRIAPEIDEIGWALGYDAEQIDALFRLASTI